MFTLLILLAYIVNDTIGKLCPVIFGQFECPLNFTCIINECYSDDNIIAPNNCEQVKCNTNSRCYKVTYKFFNFSVQVFNYNEIV